MAHTYNRILVRLRQEDGAFETSQGYAYVRPAPPQCPLIY